MREKFLLLFSFIFLSLCLEAQQKIFGKLIDAGTGEGVQGATIVVASNISISEHNGDFKVPVPQGVYVVKITSIGYKSLQQRLAFNDSTVIIALERYNLFLQPVEIRATRAGDKAPFTKTNIGSGEIGKNNLGQDLPFLLNQTPSVVVNSDAGNGVGYTGIRIRGTDATRINVTINGIPYNDAESQGTFFVDLPDLASSVSSIQIQRGVGTSSNGAGAFGATINISTNEFIETPYAAVNNSYGSFNTWKHTVKAGSGLLNGHFTIDARLSKISSDGFIDRAKSSLNSFFLSTAYLNKKSSLRFNILSGKETTYQAWNGILQETLGKNRTYNSAGTSKPGSPYENETDNYQQDNYQLFFNHQFNGNLSFNTAVFLTRGLGYYEQYKANQSFDTYGLKEPVIGNDTLRKTDLVSQLWLDNYFFGNVFSLQYRKNNSQLTIGGGINRYDGSHFGKIIWSQINIPKDYSWYNLDARKKDASAYVKLQQKLNSYLDAFADIQYRSVNYKLDGFRKNPELLIENRYKFFNPKLGLTFTRKDITGYISYAMSNKEPNRDDFEAGLLKQPRHETLHDLEVGVEKKSDAFLFAATGYYMLYHNQLVLTGQINDVGAYTRTNIPRSYRIGLELQASVKPEPWLYAGGNVTVSRNKVRNFSEFIDDYDNSGQVTYTYDNTDIAFSPTVTASATIGFLPFQNGEISFTNKYVSSQYLDNTSNQSRKLLDFYTLNSRFIYTLKSPLLKEVNLIMQLNNLLDKKYEPNGYTYSYLYGGQLQTENYLFPMAGINWMLGVNISL